MRSAPTGARDAGSTDSSINNGRDGMMRRKGTERCTAADKHAITIRLWPALLQLDDISCAKSQSREQKQNRAVALSRSSGWIAQCKSALYLFGLQISWERR